MIKTLTRDSVKYFVAIFLVYSCNQAIWLVNDISLNELMTGFGFVISAIMANRLMINVREGYYEMELSAASTRKSVPLTIPTNGFSTGGLRSPTIRSPLRSTFPPSNPSSPISPGFSIRSPPPDFDRSFQIEMGDGRSHLAVGEEEDYELKTFSESRGF